MLQLLDLARENAALKCELARIRGEAEALQRLLQQVSTEGFYQGSEGRGRAGLASPGGASERPWTGRVPEDRVRSSPGR